MSVKTKAKTLGLLGLAGLVAMASVVGTASAESPDSNVGPGSYTSDHFGFMHNLTENARLIEARKIDSRLAVKINPSLKPHFSVHGPGFIDVAAPTVNTSLKTTVADKYLAVQINPSLNLHYSVSDSAFNDIAEPTVRGSVNPTSGVHSPGCIDMAVPTISGANAVVKVDGPFTHYANGYVSSEMDAPTMNTGR